MKSHPRRNRATVPGVPHLRLVTFEPTLKDSLALVLRRCTEPQRTMLALILVERLSSAEAATTLGVTVRQFERSYHALVADLRRAMDRTNRARWRSANRRAAEDLSRARKAS